MSTDNPSTLIPFSVMDSIAADCGVDLPAARARAIAAEHGITDLESLRDAMIASDSAVMDPQHPDAWSTDLPVFGGEAPDPMPWGCWSWDARRVLVGSSADDLRIEPRAGRAIAAEKAQRNARLIREARERDAANAKARESMTPNEIIADAFEGLS